MARVLPATTYRPFQDDPPAFAVMEIQPVFGGVPGGAGRALICELEDGDAMPLELDAAAAEPGAMIPALAPDDQHALQKVLADAVAGREPDRQTSVGDLRVRLYRVPSPDLARRIRRTLEDVPMRTLYAVPEGATVAVFPLSDPALQFQPIHRALRGIPTFKPETFLTIVRDYAFIYDLEAALTTPMGLDAARELLASLSTGYHAVLLVLPEGRGKLLRFRRSMALSTYPAVPRNPTLRSLDLALLEALVLKTVLGIQQPERADHPNVSTVESLESLVAAVQEGQFQAGFALNPPPMWELRAVIEAAQQLPPRTVRVSPSPPMGLLAPISGA
ncbi:MAG: DUF1015 domain-containing protein [Myxococcaceae bacterium]